MALVLPAPDRRTTWTRGVTVGVRGGLFRFRPGGANQRLITAPGSVSVLSYSADRTGETDCTAAFTSARDAVGTDGVIDIPLGVYKMTGTATGIHKDRFTWRGRGSYLLSSTPATLGTGEKSFYVGEGHGYTPGIGVRVWRHYKPVTYMQGTVVSYTAGVLTLNVNKVGSQVYPGSPADPLLYDEIGETFTDWKVSLTYIDCIGAIAFGVGQGTDYTWSYPLTAVTNSPARETDQVTVADASAFSVGNLVKITLEDYNSPAEVRAATPSAPYSLAPSYTDRARSQMCVVTGKAGNTLTVSPPLCFALPAAKNPKVAVASFWCYEVGVEDLACGHVDATTPWGALTYSQTIDCWAYNVEAHATNNRQIWMEDSVFIELRKSTAWWRKGEGTNGTSLIMGNCTGALVEDNIFGANFPAIQINGSTVRSAFIANYANKGPFTGPGSAQFNINHGGHNSFNLYEHNAIPFFQPDGYHGSSSTETIFRNRTGINDPGWIVLNRFNSFFTAHGNVMGGFGGRDGVFSFGNPNIGNGANDGTVVNATTPGGRLWPELEGIIGTIVSVDSPTTFTATMTPTDSISLGGITAGAWPQTLHFPQTFPRASRTRTLSQVTCTGRTGSTATFSCPTEHGASVGQTFQVWPGTPGWQALDLTTQDTLDRKGNYLWTAGVGAVDVPLSAGDSFPPSLTEATSAPTEWDAGLAWPPVDHTAPSLTELIIPAAFRYHRLSVPIPPAPPSQPTGLSASVVSSSQVVLSWVDTSSNEVGFRVQQFINNTWTQIGSTGPNTGVYNVTGLSPNTQHSFRVLAYNGGGESAPSNTASATTPPSAGPGSAPALRSARAPRFTLPRA